MSNINHKFDTHTASDDELAQFTRSTIRSLFERYPNITAEERREIARYLKTGPLLDIGLLKGDETIRYKIAAFEKDHEKSLSTSGVEIGVLIGIFALTVLICSVLWDIGV